MERDGDKFVCVTGLEGQNPQEEEEKYKDKYKCMPY